MEYEEVTIRRIEENESTELACLLDEDQALRSELGFQPGKPISSREVHRKISEWSKANGAICYSILADGITAGMISLSHIDNRSGTAQIGYWIGSRYRNSGICSQAFRLAVGEASSLGIETVSATITGENQASRAIWENEGGRCVPISPGRFRYELKPGQRKPSAESLSPEWFSDPEYWAANRPFIWTEKRIEMSGTGAERIAGLLEMKPGDSILDMACGFGRHSLALSKMGYRVTGVDLNPEFISEASAKAAAQGVDVTFHCADMRDFVEHERFDSIIFMYNSFGYFQDPRDDLKVLENCLRSLKPGGSLLLSVVGREQIQRYLSPGSPDYRYEAEDGTIWLVKTETDQNLTWNTVRLNIIGDGDRKEFVYGLRIYSEPELRGLLTSCGYSGIRAFGNLSGDDFDSGSNHLIFLARRPVTENGG